MAVVGRLALALVGAAAAAVYMRICRYIWVYVGTAVPVPTCCMYIHTPHTLSIYSTNAYMHSIPICVCT